MEGSMRLYLRCSESHHNKQMLKLCHIGLSVSHSMMTATYIVAALQHVCVSANQNVGFVSSPGKVVRDEGYGREKHETPAQHNTTQHQGQHGAAKKQQSTTSKYDNALLDENKM